MTRRQVMVVVVALAVAAGAAAHWAWAQPRPPARMPRPAEKVELMRSMLKMMKRTCFEPATAGLVAVGGLKDDAPRAPAEIAKDLEEQLARTKTLGLRNAIRLTLKDVYKATGEHGKILKHLRAMLTENDKALQEAGDDEDDDDDDDD